jgi:hypothetical protein
MPSPEPTPATTAPQAARASTTPSPASGSISSSPPSVLIVELDSRRHHKTRRAFEDDRARDVLTATAGYRTLRFTARRLTTQPDAVAQAIHAVLTDRPRGMTGRPEPRVQ